MSGKNGSRSTPLPKHVLEINARILLLMSPANMKTLKEEEEGGREML